MTAAEKQKDCLREGRGNARDLLLWNESTLLTEEYKRNKKGNRYFPVFPKMYTILGHH